MKKTALILTLLLPITAFAPPTKINNLELQSNMNANGHGITNIDFLTDTNGAAITGGGGSGLDAGTTNRWKIDATNAAVFVATAATNAASAALRAGTVAATNGLGTAAWSATTAFDVAFAAMDATNGLGTAAWKNVGFFDVAGAGTTAASAATNALGTAAWSATAAFDSAGSGVTAATASTNGGHFDITGNAATATSATTANNGTLGMTNEWRTGSNIVWTIPLWSGPTNSLTIQNGYAYFKASQSISITNLTIIGQWQVLTIMNTNAATTIYGQVFATPSILGSSTTTTANTNNISIAAGKSAIWSFLCNSSILTNYSNTVQQ